MMRLYAKGWPGISASTGYICGAIWCNSSPPKKAREVCSSHRPCSKVVWRNPQMKPDGERWISMFDDEADDVGQESKHSAPLQEITRRTRLSAGTTMRSAVSGAIPADTSMPSGDRVAKTGEESAEPQ